MGQVDSKGYAAWLKTQPAEVQRQVAERNAWMQAEFKRQEQQPYYKAAQKREKRQAKKQAKKARKAKVEKPSLSATLKAQLKKLGCFGRCKKK